MKVKTIELEGEPLDWAVAQASGTDVHIRRGAVYHNVIGGSRYYPSRFWQQGGQIIEKYGISTVLDDGDTVWQAVINACSGSMFGMGLCGEHWQAGSSPLISAMRCPVHFKLGDEVEIPEELL